VQTEKYQPEAKRQNIGISKLYNCVTDSQTASYSLSVRMMELTTILTAQVFIVSNRRHEVPAKSAAKLAQSAGECWQSAGHPH